MKRILLSLVLFFLLSLFYTVSFSPNVLAAEPEASAGADKPPPPPAPAPPCAAGKFIDGRCTSVNTGFGELPTDAGGFISKMFAIILAASGAIALILMMRAGYKIMMSQGKPETVQEGRDQLTSAIVGLLFIIFAFVFLELIGVSILRIPGLGGGGTGTCYFGRAC